MEAAKLILVILHLLAKRELQTSVYAWAGNAVDLDVKVAKV